MSSPKNHQLPSCSHSMKWHLPKGMRRCSTAISAVNQTAKNCAKGVEAKLPHQLRGCLGPLQTYTTVTELFGTLPLSRFLTNSIQIWPSVGPTQWRLALPALPFQRLRQLRAINNCTLASYFVQKDGHISRGHNKYANSELVSQALSLLPQFLFGGGRGGAELYFFENRPFPLNM